MAHRLISHHRAFFSPKYISGTSSYVTTTAVVRRPFDVNGPEEFQQRVVDADKPVLVDFHAAWCGPCKVLNPMLNEVLGQFEGKVDLAKIDIDNTHNQELAMNYHVSVVPTVLAFKNGKIVDKFSGIQEKDKLESFVKRLTEQ